MGLVQMRGRDKAVKWVWSGPPHITCSIAQLHQQRWSLFGNPENAPNCNKWHVISLLFTTPMWVSSVYSVIPYGHHLISTPAFLLLKDTILLSLCVSWSSHKPLGWGFIILSRSLWQRKCYLLPILVWWCSWYFVLFLWRKDRSSHSRWLFTGCSFFGKG